MGVFIVNSASMHGAVVDARGRVYNQLCKHAAVLDARGRVYSQ